MKIVLLGFSGSGKTSFIAALWNLVRDGRSPTQVGNVSQIDRSYLNEIGDRWLRFEKPIHTPVSVEEQPISLTLTNSGWEAPIEVDIPDIAGELFERWLTNREWPSAFDKRLQTADLVLLFLHSDVEEPVSLIEAASVLPPLESVGEHEEKELAEFEWKTMPTQAKVLDLMQVVSWRLNGLPAVRIVVSAWDKPAQHFKTPADWLRAQLPMLSQYLDANGSSEVVGLSAQLGDWPEQQESIASRSHGRPLSERLMVVDSAGAPIDLAELLHPVGHAG